MIDPVLAARVSELEETVKALLQVMWGLQRSSAGGKTGVLTQQSVRLLRETAEKAGVELPGVDADYSRMTQ